MSSLDTEKFICGRVLETEKMIGEAVKLLGSAKSFSISSKIPKEWLVKEEEIWDKKLESRSESIKNRLNRILVSGIIEKTKLDYDIDGDVRVVFDFKTGNVSMQSNEIFIFGRYKKLVPGISQSRWTCTKCSGKGCPECNGKGKYYLSVEEVIGEPLKQEAAAEDYVLHASGREDVDATNSGGRAFVIEIKNPDKRNLDLKELEKKIAETGKVIVSDMRIVRRNFVQLVTESHFDKTYAAEVEFGKEIGENEVRKIEELAGKTILQRTPNRVAHRRADLVRQRKVKTIDVRKAKEKTAEILISAEAGTYIKELISGDEGRTKPSIAEVLGTSAACRRLEVTKIEDGFLDFCFEN